MAKLLKLRRGTTSQHSSFTGAEGEVTIDTNKDVPVVHDGSTAGGHPVAAEDMSNVSSASIAGRLGNDSIATDKIAAGNLPSDVKIVTANITDGTIVNADISANAAIAGTKLENSGVTAGQYGSSSAIPIVTVDAQGLVTAASTTAIDSTTIANGTSNVAVANNGDITTTRSGTARHVVDGAGVHVTGTLDITGQTNVAGGVLRLGTADTASGHINAYEVMTFNIDTDNDDTNRHFAFYKNGSSGSGTELFKIAESGQATVTGNLDVSSGVDVTGNITCTGTVDGVNIGGQNTLMRSVVDNTGVIADNVTTNTQSAGNNSTRLATTAFVTTAVNNAEPFPSGTKMIFQQSSAPTGWTKITSSVNNKALRLVSGNVSSGGNQAFTSAFASRTPAGNVGTSGNSTASFSANATTGNSTASFSGSVSGNTGNSGASTSNVSTGGNVNNHTLSNNQVPSHSHSFNIGNYDNYGDGDRIVRRNSNNAGNQGTNNSGGGGSHSHGFSGSSHSHNVNNHTHSFSGNFSGNTGNHTHSVSVSGNTGNHTHSGGSFSGSAMDFAVQYIDVIVCSKD